MRDRNLTPAAIRSTKKWLSYRKIELPGRTFHLSKANEVRDTERRISAILLMNDSLDENYLATKKTNAVTVNTNQL